MRMGSCVRQLSPDVIKKLRTGINVTSISHCVEELVLNSVDAGATCIAIHLNLPVYQIQVIDNGEGIDIEQMKMVGNRYATSKCHSLQDLKNLKSCGFRGEALSSLKELCSLLMIESRSALSTNTYCKIFTQGNALDPQKSLNSRPSKGTTVSVYDFMYNMPVRRNSFSASLDFEESRKCIQAIALMHPNVSFTLKNEATGEVCLQLRKCDSLYRSFFQLFGKRKSDNLKEVHFKKGNYEISGCISTECNVSKDLQFLYVNKHLLLHTKLHKLINNVLNKVLCSKHKLRQESKKLTSDGYSPTKSQAQYCIFVLNISCGYDKYDIIFEPRKTIIEFLEWDDIIKLVEDCLIDFLKRENLFFITEGRSTVPVETTAENVSHKFDTHDYKQALFSHAVRRLQKNTEVEGIKTVANENPGNDVSKSSSIDTLKSVNDDSSLVCISSKCIDESVLDRLKQGTSKAATSDCRYSIAVNASTTLKNNLNASYKSIFPTKSPVLLNIPVRSTLSELQKGSSSLDLLSKLKDKFQFSPVKRSFLPPNKNDFELEKKKRNYANVPPQCVLSSSNPNKNVSTEVNINNVLKATKDKSFQCPSISIDILKRTQFKNKDISHSEVNVVKIVKDKSFQCPSVSCIDKKRIVSRFDFGEESSETPLKFLTRKRKNPCSSKDLIKNHINTVENLLNDTSNSVGTYTKVNHSVCPSKTVMQQKKSVCFDNVLDNCGTGVSNAQDSYFNNISLDLNYTKAGISKQGCLDQFVNLKTSVENHFCSGGSVMKTSCDLQERSGKAATKFEDIRSSPCLDNRDLSSNSPSYQNTLISKSVNLNKYWFKNAFNDVKSKRCIEETQSSLSSVGEFNDSIPVRDLGFHKNDPVEIYSCSSSDEASPSKMSYPLEYEREAFQYKSTDMLLNQSLEAVSSELESPELQNEDEANNIRNKNPNKRSYPFEPQNDASHYNNTDMLLNQSFDSSSLELVSPELQTGGNDEIEDNFAPGKNYFYPVDINYCLNQNNKTIACDIMAIINELVNITKEANSVDSPENTSHALLKSNNSRVPKLRNSLISSMDSNSEEFVKHIHTVDQNVSQHSSNPQNVLENTDNLCSFDSSGIFVQSSYSNLSENSHSSILLETHCRDLRLGSFDIDNVNSVRSRTGTGFPLLTSDVLSVNLEANKESISESIESDAKIEESKNYEETINFESCSMFLEEPFSELAGMENKSVSCAQGFENSSDIFEKRSAHQTTMLCVTHEHDSSAVNDEEVNRRISNSKDSFNKSNVTEMNEPIAENSKSKQKQNYWKAHLEPATRRTVYIDVKTGNSSFASPVVAETSGNNLTSLPQTGASLKSHFFLTHDYSPFVSKTQTPKVEGICNDLKDNLKNFLKTNEIQEQSKKWRIDKDQIDNDNIDSDSEFQALFNRWENPVFKIPFEVDSIGDSKTLQSLPQMCTFLNSYKFSRNTLKSLQVIGQVDCKFIACVLKNFNKDSQDQKLLAMFDQHAVHERVQLEEIMEDLYETNSNGDKSVKSESIFPILHVSLDFEEIRLLQTYHENLHRIGIKLKIDDCQSCSIYSVPACLVHKKTKDLRRSQTDTILILQNTISEWLSSIVKTRSIPQTLPKTLASVVNSQACRGAVKFGDPLTLEQCCALLKSLSMCKLPFQCAHGRPSVAPILDLNKVESMWKKKRLPQIRKLSEQAKDNT